MPERPTFDEVAAAEEILVENRHRLHVLQIREAKSGDSTPPEVLREIASLSARIAAQAADVERLKTEAAIDRYPLNEARYRKSLARAWTNSRSKLSVEDTVSLELERLELGILPDRARELEQEMREALAEDLFYRLDPKLIPKGDWIWSRETQIVMLMIRLEPVTVMRLFLHYTQVDISHQLDIHKSQWLEEVNAWPGTEDYARLESCLEQLITAFCDRRAELGPQPEHSYI